MSYVRWSENSEVYIYSGEEGDNVGVLVCCGCHVSRSTQDMVEHLEKHKADGDIFPDNLIDNIKADDIYNFGELKDNDAAIEEAMRLGLYHG